MSAPKLISLYFFLYVINAVIFKKFFIKSQFKNAYNVSIKSLPFMSFVKINKGSFIK